MSKRASKGIKIWLLLLVAVAAAAVWIWQANLLGSLQSKLTSYLKSVTAVQLPDQNKDKTIAYSFAILSDSHQDTTYFPQIVAQIAERQDIVFAAHLGDLSDAGDKTELQKAKAILDTIKPPVYVLPGDHDLNWFPNHDLANFKQVFQLKKTYYSFNRGQQHFVFIDNSDLNHGISEAQWSWLQNDLNDNNHKDIYVFMSTPLSNPYLAFKAMGSQSQAVKDQSVQLGQLLRQYPVKVIFAGDTHTFAQYQDKESGLNIVTVGAAGSTKNLLPLYVNVDIFTDGSYNATSKPYSHAISVTGND